LRIYSNITYFHQLCKLLEDTEVDKRADKVKDCHSEQHVGTLTFLEFEARFVPTQKRLRASQDDIEICAICQLTKILSQWINVAA